MEVHFDTLRSDMQRQFDRMNSRLDGMSADIKGLGDKMQALGERIATTETKVEMLASNRALEQSIPPLSAGEGLKPDSDGEGDAPSHPGVPATAE